MKIVNEGVGVAMDVHGSDLGHTREGSQNVNAVPDAASDALHTIQSRWSPGGAHRFEWWKAAIVAANLIPQPPTNHIHFAFGVCLSDLANELACLLSQVGKRLTP